MILKINTMNQSLKLFMEPILKFIPPGISHQSKKLFAIFLFLFKHFYLSRYDGDIALIEMQQGVQFLENFIERIVLPIPEMQASPGKNGFVVGEFKIVKICKKINLIKYLRLRSFRNRDSSRKHPSAY